MKEKNKEIDFMSIKEFVGITALLFRHYDKNGLEFPGPVYNIYLSDELSVIEPEQYLLQISVSVKNTNYHPKINLNKISKNTLQNKY